MRARVVLPALCVLLLLLLCASAHAALLPRDLRADMKDEQLGNLATFFFLRFLGGDYERLSGGEASGATLDDYRLMLHNIDPGPNFPSEAVAAPLFARLDKDGNGRVEWTEFLEPYAGLLGAGEGPEQVHLALTNNPSEMVVVWITSDSYGSMAPVVHYGADPDQLSQTVTGASSTYNVGILGGWHKEIHKAKMTNLQPYTRYFYKVGNGSVWSQQFSFVSAPTGPLDTINVAVYADVGTTIPFGDEVTKQIAADHAIDPFNLLVLPGDMAYAGTGHEDEWEPIWDLFGTQAERVSAVMPYMMAVGNHEKYYNYTSFLARYQMPSADSGGYSNFWFSFDYANIHFVMMSTEHSYAPNSDQYKWLEQDLRKASSSGKYDWILLSGHRPFLSSDQDEYDQHNPNAPLITIIEPLLLQYHVDLVLTGHMHMYERVFPYPPDNSTVPGTTNVFKNPTSPAYLVMGSGGCFIHETLMEPAPAWSANRQQKYGYARLQFTNKPQPTMHFEFRLTEENKVGDEMWIIKDKSTGQPTIYHQKP